jgi:hypothetical protein
MQFAVGEVPEKKIADTPLAACPHEQIRLPEAGQTGIFGQHRLVDVCRISTAGNAVVGQTARGLNNVPTPTVIHRNDKLEAVIAGRLLFRRRHIAAEGGRKPAAIAHKMHTHLIGVQRIHFTADGTTEQIHQ